MSDFSNIPTGLNITTQIPLNVKTYCLSESLLSNLGTNDNLAFTYHDGLIVFCVEERTSYEWREVQTGEENTGLVTDDFTYPSNIICFGIDYSNKTFNFFRKDFAYTTDVKEITSIDNSVTIDETSSTIDLSVPIYDGSETKINAGTNIVKTGLGTTASPYVITSNITGLVTVGSGISITGLGTVASPYILTVSNNNGWLKGDTKEVVCDNTYITNNFETRGLGKNERIGWAILNGATHTYNGVTTTVPNDNGKVVIAFGSDYLIPNVTGGNKNSDVPEHYHFMFASEVNTGGPGVGIVTNDKNVARATSGKDELGYEMGYAGVTDIDSATLGRTSTEGNTITDNNMQPYIVRLRIVKL